jgi:hypothetical protein
MNPFIPRTGLVLAALSLAQASLAQNPPPVSGDVMGRHLPVNLILLRPGEFVYQTTLERDASTTTLGVRTVTISRTTYAGVPSWLLLETRTGDGIPAADSVFADLTTLRAIHWSSSQGQARVAAEFRGDSVFGATSAPQGKRSIVAAVPGGTLVSAAMLETELRLLPLQSTWEDSTTMLTVTTGTNAVLPTRIAVIGEDRVSVPAGAFDCWVVSVRADVAKGLYWVTKQDPVVVRSALDVPSLGGAQLVSSLTKMTK